MRLTLLAGTVFLLVSDGVRDSPLAAFPAGISPYTAILGLVSVGTLTLFGAAGLLMAALSALRLRWFCRWVCPLGTCNELSSQVGRRLRLRTPAFPRLGRDLVFLALGGALLGSPILLWLDPLALFSGLGQRFAAEPWNRAVGLSGIAVAVAVSFFLPRLWCGRICPLGGLQEILFSVRRGLTGWVSQRLARPPLVDSVFPRETAPAASLPEVGCVGRRVMLALAGGAVWAWVSPRLGANETVPLRPPGASPDDRRFLSLCVRCGNCVRVCPTGIVRPQLFAGSPTAWLVPHVTFVNDYCLPTCNRCGEVCPSGALLPFSLAEKPVTLIGKAVLEGDLCLLSEDRECGICRGHCPYHAIRLEFNEETYSVLPVVDLDRCPGCGACEAICPTVPRKAIRVVRV